MNTLELLFFIMILIHLILTRRLYAIVVALCKSMKFIDDTFLWYLIFLFPYFFSKDDIMEISFQVDSTI